MNIENYMVELIQNMALVCFISFFLSLFTHSRMVTNSVSSVKVHFAYGLLGSLFAYSTFIFNFTSNSHILNMTGLFIIFVTVYLFHSPLSSSIILCVMIMNRVLIMGGSFSIVQWIYIGFTIILLLMMKWVKVDKLKWLTGLILTLVLYTILNLQLGEYNSYIITTCFAFFCIGVLIYFVFDNVDHAFIQYNKFMTYSSRDYLTKLYNRRKLNLDALIFEKEATRHISIAFLDVDNFKVINDTLGHLIGDEVLKRIGQIIIEEKIPGLQGYRMSGEEFCIIFRNNNQKAIKQYIELIQQKIKEAQFCISQNNKLEVTVSVGLAHNQSNHFTIRELITIADELMYEAKNLGKNKLIEKVINI